MPHPDPADTDLEIADIAAQVLAGRPINSAQARTLTAVEGDAVYDMNEGVCLSLW